MASFTQIENYFNGLLNWSNQTSDSRSLAVQNRIVINVYCPIRFRKSFHFLKDIIILNVPRTKAQPGPGLGVAVDENLAGTQYRSVPKKIFCPVPGT